jgi:hypothetical protein
MGNQLIVNKESLLEFIANAHKNTFAAPEEIRKVYRLQTPKIPGHKEYLYKEIDKQTGEEWVYHDSYCPGRLTAPGREVVFYKEVPVWFMAYQGGMTHEFTPELKEETMRVLKKALLNPEPSRPFRGPPRLEEGNFIYTFSMFSIIGAYDSFLGVESILHKATEVFRQNIMGQLIE